MPVRLFDRLDAFPFLRQVPAADRFVVADAEEVFPPRVKDEAADPVVVADEVFDQGAARVPEFDAFIPGPGGQEFPGAARSRGLFETGHGCQVDVSGGGRESAALDCVVVAEKRRFCFAGGGVPESGRLVRAAREEPPPVEAGRDVADPVDVAAEGLDAVAGRDVPDAQCFISRSGNKEVS